MIAHRRAGAAAAAVREQRDVRSRFKISNRSVSREKAEFNEVVPAAAGAELRPGTVLVLLRDRADRPIGVEHLVFATLFERRTDPETRFRLDRARETVLPPVQVIQADVEHGHLHAAGDVHADRVRDHRVLRGQHAADRQTVTDMRIGHERARDRNRQQTRLLHLHDRLGFQPFAPLAILHWLGPRRRGRSEQRSGKLAPQRVGSERRRIIDNGFHFVLDPHLVSAAEDKLADEIRSAPHGFSQRHAQAKEVFRVHAFNHP